MNSGFIASWNPFGTGSYFDIPPPSSGPDPKLGYSLNPGISVASLSVEDSQLMMKMFDTIAREKGLGEQDYQCADCKKAVGSIFGDPKVNLKFVRSVKQIENSILFLREF